MTTMRFDGTAHQLTVISGDGRSARTYTAFNNVDRHATLTHLPNGTYSFADTTASHHHAAPGADTPDGGYGSYGILRFNVPGHVGIGVHSGRAHAPYQPGPPHQTQGCIRTDDEAMRQITSAIASDPLTTIEIINNDRVTAAQGQAIHGVHHASPHQ